MRMRNIVKRNAAATIALIATLSMGVLWAESKHEINAASGIHSWELHDQGAGFTLMQITPDQARAFFLARGFDRSAVDYYASSCVFMTIVRNEGKETIINNLADWRVIRKGVKLENLKLASDWLVEWKQRKVAASSLIAFEWSQFPQLQSFEGGDWNQGMTTYTMPSGSAFDLNFVWKKNGEKHEATLANIQCAGIESDR